MAMVRFDHGWKEFMKEQVMRDDVDVKDFTQSVFRDFEDGLRVANSSIVDQNRRLAMVLPYLRCHECNIG